MKHELVLSTPMNAEGRRAAEGALNACTCSTCGSSGIRPNSPLRLFHQPQNFCPENCDSVDSWLRPFSSRLRETILQNTISPQTLELWNSGTSRHQSLVLESTYTDFALQPYVSVVAAAQKLVTTHGRLASSQTLRVRIVTMGELTAHAKGNFTSHSEDSSGPIGSDVQSAQFLLVWLGDAEPRWGHAEVIDQLIQRRTGRQLKTLFGVHPDHRNHEEWPAWGSSLFRDHLSRLPLISLSTPAPKVAPTTPEPKKTPTKAAPLVLAGTPRTMEQQRAGVRCFHCKDEIRIGTLISFANNLRVQREDGTVEPLTKLSGKAVCQKCLGV